MTRLFLIALFCGLVLACGSPDAGTTEAASAVDGVDADGPEILTFSKVYGPYDLKPGGLMQMPAEEFLKLDEPIHILAYRTEIIDAEGNKLDDSLHCHTSFRTLFDEDWMSWSMAKEKIDTIPFKGLYSDGHTTELRFPEGFGLRLEQGESLRLIPMFNNRGDAQLDAAMRVTWDYVQAKDLKNPPRPLFSAIQSVIYPHLYMVEPGIDVREIDFDLSFNGRIHLIAVHVHPYGKAVELINETKDESVWIGVGDRKPDGRLTSMPVYSSVEGYPFRAGEKYRLRVTYDNPTAQAQDAMGGIFLFFSTENDEMPRPDMTGVTLRDPSQAKDSGHDHGH